jgi:hypothetical protein
MKWSDLLLAEEQARIIAKKLKTQIQVSTGETAIPSIEEMKLSKIPVVDVRTTVPPLSVETVYEYVLPQGYFGVIVRLTTMYYLGDELYFYVDGGLYEPPIKRAIGVYPNTPVKVFIPFEESIVWKVMNETNDEKTYGILCEGYQILKKYKDYLIKLVISGGL